jgi:hypothetical protein
VTGELGYVEQSVSAASELVVDNTGLPLVTDDVLIYYYLVRADTGSFIVADDPQDFPLDGVPWVEIVTEFHGGGIGPQWEWGIYALRVSSDYADGAINQHFHALGELGDGFVRLLRVRNVGSEWTPALMGSVHKHFTQGTTTVTTSASGSPSDLSLIFSAIANTSGFTDAPLVDVDGDLAVWQQASYSIGPEDTSHSERGVLAFGALAAGDTSATISEANVYFGLPVFVFDFPATPVAPPVVEVGECPVHVKYLDISYNSNATPGSYAHNGEEGTFSDGSQDWYEPTHVPGDLLVWVCISSKIDLTTPPGYTEVSNEVWDNAPITPPFLGPNSGSDGPSPNEHVQQIIAYRIADDTWTDETVPVGTFSGLIYTPSPPSIGSDQTGVGVRVYRFALEQMGGDYPRRTDWPSPPVKVGTLVTEDYLMAEGSGGGAFTDIWPSGDDPPPASLTMSDVTADHIGNHIWMSLVTVHGPILQEIREPDDGGHWGSMEFYAGEPPNPDIYPRQFLTSGTPGLDDYGVIISSAPYDNHSAVAYLSNYDYFRTDSPPVPYGFQDETPWPGSSVLGHVGGGYCDGFIGVAGTDFNCWNLRGGVALQQILIQAPESARPFNDNLAAAYDNTICPVQLVECAFGATAEVGELFPDNDTSDPPPLGSVWIKWTPTSTQTVDIVTVWDTLAPLPGELDTAYTEYDTVLAVYSGSPGSLVLEVSNDDTTGDYDTNSRSSAVTLDAVGGTTYYIQVAGYGGDEGRFVLTIDCERVAYWGILVTAS